MIILKILIVLIALIQFGCSDSNDRNPGIAQSENTSISDKDILIAIGPDIAVKGTILNLKIDNSLLNNNEIQWLIDGIPAESAKSTRFDTSNLRKGNTVMVSVMKGDKEFHSNEIIIANTPPNIISAKLLPELPTASSTLTVKVNSSDVDNDSISFNYKWYLNNSYAGNDSFLETEMKRGDMVSVEIAPTDREDTGKSVKLTSKIFNSLPAVTESSPVINGNIYKHYVKASDPDSDTLTFTLKKGPEGMSIDQSGILTWEIKPDNKGDHDIEVLINDNHGGEILVPISTSISFTQ